MSYKLFLIKIKKPATPWYDTLRSVVMMAKNEQSARKMIISNKLYGEEVNTYSKKNSILEQPELWLSPKFATAKIIGIPTPNMGKRTKVIIVDFLNG